MKKTSYDRMTTLYKSSLPKVNFLKGLKGFYVFRFYRSSFLQEKRLPQQPHLLKKTTLFLRST